MTRREFFAWLDECGRTMDARFAVNGDPRLYALWLWIGGSARLCTTAPTWEKIEVRKGKFRRWLAEYEMAGRGMRSDTQTPVRVGPEDAQPRVAANSF